MDVNPYRAGEEIVRAELVVPTRQPLTSAQRTLIWLMILLSAPGWVPFVILCLLAAIHYCSLLFG
jgi:hypothetical protein